MNPCESCKVVMTVACGNPSAVVKCSSTSGDASAATAGVARNSHNAAITAAHRLQPTATVSYSFSTQELIEAGVVSALLIPTPESQGSELLQVKLFDQELPLLHA